MTLLLITISMMTTMTMTVTITVSTMTIFSKQKWISHQNVIWKSKNDNDDNNNDDDNDDDAADDNEDDDDFLKAEMRFPSKCKLENKAMIGFTVLQSYKI